MYNFKECMCKHVKPNYSKNTIYTASTVYKQNWQASGSLHLAILTPFYDESSWLMSSFFTVRSNLRLSAHDYLASYCMINEQNIWKYPDSAMHI